MTDFDRQALHQFLTGRYDLEGLKTLCHYLDVDYDNLDGRTKDALARELVRYMERVGRVGELVALEGKETRGARPASEDSLLGPLPRGERGSAPNLTRFGSHTLDSRIHRKTGIELIRIPAGPFLYGSDEHLIYLPEYWIGRYPVTNTQYQRFVNATDYSPPEHWSDKKPPQDKLDHPVVGVSWYDARNFCNWADLRLPTEQEWEKVARGTDGRIYPWGNAEPTADLCNFDLNVGGTTPVGMYLPKSDSPYSCADMAGNALEWTASWSRKESAYAMRGGGFSVPEDGVAITYQYFFFPDAMYSDLGFRVAELLSDPES